MHRLVYRQISTIQITSIELVWMEGDPPASTTAKLPLPAPAQADHPSPGSPAHPASRPCKRKRRRETRSFITLESQTILHE
jgi:hypothetical protein